MHNEIELQKKVKTTEKSPLCSRKDIISGFLENRERSRFQWVCVLRNRDRELSEVWTGLEMIPKFPTSLSFIITMATPSSSPHSSSTGRKKRAAKVRDELFESSLTEAILNPRSLLFLFVSHDIHFSRIFCNCFNSL